MASFLVIAEMGSEEGPGESLGSIVPRRETGWGKSVI